MVRQPITDCHTCSMTFICCLFPFFELIIDQQDEDGGVTAGLRSHPGVIDASDALLRPVQHKEGCQVGSIRRYDDHSKTCPHHTQDPG